MKNFEHIGNIINKVLASIRKETGDELHKIFCLWDSMAGEHIAKKSHPAGLTKNCLVVHVTDSGLIQHLQFFKKDLIAKINNALQKELVEDIRFVIGPVHKNKD